MWKFFILQVEQLGTQVVVHLIHTRSDDTVITPSPFLEGALSTSQRFLTSYWEPHSHPLPPEILSLLFCGRA